MKKKSTKNSSNAMEDSISPDNGSPIKRNESVPTSVSPMGFSFSQRGELSSWKSNIRTFLRPSFSSKTSIFPFSLSSFLFGNSFPVRLFAGMIRMFSFPSPHGSVPSLFAQ